MKANTHVTLMVDNTAPPCGKQASTNVLPARVLIFQIKTSIIENNLYGLPRCYNSRL